jgi:hypothetical protein
VYWISHLLPINTPIISLEHDEALAGDVQTRGLDLLDAVDAAVLVGVDDLLHFLRADGEAGGCGPDAVAVAVEDGCFVDVAGADQATRGGGLECRVIAGFWAGWEGEGEGEVPLVNISWKARLGQYYFGWWTSWWSWYVV